MGKLPHVESFRDLVVYRKVRQLSLEIVQITKTFPNEGGDVFIYRPNSEVFTLYWRLSCGGLGQETLRETFYQQTYGCRW